MPVDIFDDQWLEHLDIPDIPDFSAPSFNPYHYDNADEWFTTHRETADNEHLQMLMLKRAELNKPKYLRTIAPNNQQIPSKAFKPGHSPARLPAKGPIRVFPKSGLRDKAAESRPLTAATNSKFPTKNHLDRSVVHIVRYPPEHKRSQEVLNNHAKKPSIAEHKRSYEVLNIFPKKLIGAPANSKPALRSPVRGGPERPKSAFGHRHNDFQGNGKWSSVEAARAGAYFAGILRSYPTDESKGKVHPSWK